MAAPRKPRAARTPRAPRVAGTRETTTGAVGGGELVQAAEEIADQARKFAATWSKTVPASIRTEQESETSITIVADAPPAYPNETDARHPVFARGLDRRKWTWVAGNNRPFLGPAADQRAGAAMAKYAKKIDRMVRESGLVK
jgi:hypothetical protein